MELKSLLRAGTVALAALLLVAGAVQTASAQSMGEPDAGTFLQGYELGLENGSIMVRRVRLRTIEGDEGCSALSRMQEALRMAQRRIRAPYGSTDRFVRGFHSGYSRALRMGIREARAQCGRAVFYDGAYPGELSGAQFCSLLESSPSHLDGFIFEPIYEGWTMDEEVKTSCKVAFKQIASECVEGLPLQNTIAAAVQSACI